MIWPGKGPYPINRRSVTAGSTFDPTTATPDMTIVPGTGTRVYGSGTFTPYLYIADQGNHRIQVLDFDGNFLFEFGSFGTGDGLFDSPYGVCTDGTYVYVTDQGNHRVQAFTLLGVYVAQWGSFGTGNSEFNSPKGICTDGRFVYVVDSGNNRFQIFTMGSTFVTKRCSYGISSDPEYLNAPTKCTVDPFFLCVQDTGYLKWYALNQIADYIIMESPAPSMTITGGWPSGRVVMESPAPSMSIIGTTYRVGTIIMESPAPEMSIEGVTWHVNSLIMQSPTPQMILAGYVGRFGTVVMESPSPEMIIDGYAWHVGQVVMVSPDPQLIFTGYVVLASPEYLGIAMNMRNKGITTYSDLTVKSMAIVNGKAYFSNDNGIFLMEGDTDNGTAIDAYVKTGLFDLHDPAVQRIVDAWLALRLSGAGTLTIYENEETDGVSEDVIVEDDKMHEERITLPQGLEGRFVEVRFENIDGSDFDLSGINVRTRPLNRPKLKTR